MAKSYTALPHELLEETEELNDAEFGRLIKAMMRYSMSGEPIDLNGSERFYAKRVMNIVDRFNNSETETSEKRSEAGRKGAEARWQKMANDGKTWQTHSANSKNGYTNTNTKPIPNQKKDTPISPGKKDPESGETEADAKAVIDYLNQAAKTKYRYSEHSLKHIRARLNEKYTVEDCKTVIDKKCSEWIGDTKMQQYLRPETLFGSKFENYLNAPASQPSGKRQYKLPDYYNPDPNRPGSGEYLTPEEVEEAKKLLAMTK